MKIYFKILLFLILYSSCQNNKNQIDMELDYDIVPIPKKIKVIQDNKGLAFEKKILVFSNHPEIEKLLKVLKKDIKNVTSLDIDFSMASKEYANMVFDIQENYQDEQYSIHVNEKIHVKGGSYRALAMAKSSLLQILIKNKGSLAFPLVEINDNPDSEYRGLLIDLARMWHDIPTLKNIIDMAAFYKINHIQLHLSDDQSFTFPMEKYPKI